MRIALCLHGLVGSKSSKYGGKDNINIEIPYKFLRKNLLNSNINKLDDYDSHSLKTDYFKKNLKEKSFKVLEKIKRLKKYGKKNTH